MSVGSFCAFGLQINTDGYGFAAVDINGDVIDEQWVDCDMEQLTANEVFDNLNNIVLDSETKARELGYIILGGALALPGVVIDGSILLASPNLGWKNLNLGQYELVERLNVFAANEANLAAIAQIPGFATQRKNDSIMKPSDSFIYISTDIGIGGAVVRDGHVVYGENGFAGEIGHVSVSLDGPICRCGRRGCLEAFAGRRALVETARIASGCDATKIEAVNVLLERWKSGDEIVVSAVDKAVEALVSVIGSAVNLLDINTVILGGIWQRFGVCLTQRISKELTSEVLCSEAVNVRVLMSEVGGRSALLGAAQVALRRFIDKPLDYIEQSSIDE
ncbi:N-acetylmannosamine kinase [Chlamydia trachomatis]|nr:N-acetylmannosamine kinase [Chlamydia trachomatis]